jgi:hypothetical protein
MNINIECEISLSKKLRAILKDGGGTLTLTASSLSNGLGSALLVLSNDDLDINSVKQSLRNETSIQLTPTHFEIDRPTGHSHANIFSSSQSESKPMNRTVIDRLAATKAPEKGRQAHSIKIKEEIETPEVFQEYKEPEFQKWVSNFQELMMAVKAASGKESEIDVESIQNPRQKALAMEMKEQAEAIDMPAYIVNDVCQSITLNDMNISLKLNSPFNLNNISAKRIADSSDLKAMINQGLLKFISPEQAVTYISKTNEVYSDTLAVGGVDELLGGEGMEVESDYIETEFYGDKPSLNNQNKLAGLINLTGGVFETPLSGLPNKNIPSKSSSNSQGIKTIARK